MSVIKQNTLCASLIALGMIFGYLENMLPSILPVYGVKIGFSNLVVLYALLEMDTKSAYIIAVLKSVLSGLLFSGIVSIVYSITGILLALIGMGFAKKWPSVTEIGISCIGSAMFQVGQIFIACFILNANAPIYYLPYLLLSSVPCGMLSGFLVAVIRKRVPFLKLRR